MGFLSKFLGDSNKRVLDKLQPKVEVANNFEKDFEKLSDEQIFLQQKDY